MFNLEAIKSTENQPDGKKKASPPQQVPHGWLSEGENAEYSELSDSSNVLVSVSSRADFTWLSPLAWKCQLWRKSKANIACV